MPKIRLREKELVTVRSVVRLRMTALTLTLHIVLTRSVICCDGCDWPPSTEHCQGVVVIVTDRQRDERQVNVLMEFLF